MTETRQPGTWWYCEGSPDLVRDFTTDELRVLRACVSKAIELKEKK